MSNKIEFNWPDSVPQTDALMIPIQHMLDRMAISHFKYGDIEETKGKIAFIPTIRKAIDAYLNDGNTEHLIDAMNYLGMLFLFPHSGSHFTPTDSDKSLGREWLLNEFSGQTPNKTLPSGYKRG